MEMQPISHVALQSHKGALHTKQPSQNPFDNMEKFPVSLRYVEISFSSTATGPVSQKVYNKLKMQSPQKQQVEQHEVFILPLHTLMNTNTYLVHVM